MNPVIRIPDSTYERLKHFAEPFVDSPADVISKALDSLEQQQARHQPVTYTGIEESMRLDPDNAPDLTHTRVLEVRVNGNTKKPKWNQLVRQLHKVALDAWGDFDTVQRSTLSNIEQGQKDTSGFRYAPELGFSIQSVPSNQAWSNVLHLAKQLGVEVEVRFEWMQKENALHPGSSAILKWPTS